MEPGHFDREDFGSNPDESTPERAPQWSPVISTGKTCHPRGSAVRGEQRRNGARSFRPGRHHSGCHVDSSALSSRNGARSFRPGRPGKGSGSVTRPATGRNGARSFRPGRLPVLVLGPRPDLLPQWSPVISTGKTRSPAQTSCSASTAAMEPGHFDREDPAFLDRRKDCRR